MRWVEAVAGRVVLLTRGILAHGCSGQITLSVRSPSPKVQGQGRRVDILGSLPIRLRRVRPA